MAIDYEVLDPNGVLYSELGFDGGPTLTMPQGGHIRQGDVDKGQFTLGGLAALEAAGRIRDVSGGIPAQNKKMANSQKKVSDDEN